MLNETKLSISRRVSVSQEPEPVYSRPAPLEKPGSLKSEKNMNLESLKNISSKLDSKISSGADKVVDFINSKSQKLKLPTVQTESSLGLSPVTIVVLLIVAIMAFKPKF